ncbi:hypothetical protein [Peptacetobacter sp. AB845]|uniref:hypothetical protein n=1 Tax=Peptacetobacter sp. AB845 TaxID=3388429 RepID=UPI0039C931DB
MNKKYIIEREEYQQFICDNLHALLNTGLSDDKKYIDVKMLELAYKLLISDLYEMADVLIKY